MYDDEIQAPISMASGTKYYKVAKFPTRNIKTPIVLVYGGSDSLVDIKLMLRELPKHTEAVEVPHYEHLDFLWASDVDKLVFPHVLSALDFYAGPSKSKEAKALRGVAQSPQLPSYSEAERANAPLKSPFRSIALESDDADDDSDAVEMRRTFKAGHSPHPSLAPRTFISGSLPPVAARSSAVSNRPEPWSSSEEAAGTVNGSPTPRRSSNTPDTLLATDDCDSLTPRSRKSSKMSIESGRSSLSGKSSEKTVTFGIGVGKASPAQSVVDRSNVTPEKLDEDKARKKGKKK